LAKFLFFARYIDQPVGTGFSYANSDYVHDEASVGIEMYAFITKFLTQFPQYASLPFFIVGESYGKYNNTIYIEIDRFRWLISLSAEMHNNHRFM
jgi:hypothetical protein